MNHQDEQEVTHNIDTVRRSVRREVRERQRAVAEREAVRLARPSRSIATNVIRHVPKEKSSISSTPAGYGIDILVSKRRNQELDAVEDDKSHFWCGPFAVARQMIAERDEARRKREAALSNPNDKHNVDGIRHHPLDDVLEEIEKERKQEENPSMKWRAKCGVYQEREGANNGMKHPLHKEQNLYARRKRRFAIQSSGLNTSMGKGDGIPSLFRLCLDFLVENFEEVESLGLQIDNSIRRAISESLVAAGKMNGAAFDTLAEDGIESLEMIDCVQVSQDQLAETLEKLIPHGLTSLLLNNCGRCFGSKVVDSIAKASQSGDVYLFAISLGGAYLLRDSDSARLITVLSSKLSSLEFKACPLLGSDFCRAISSNFGTNKGCLLELSLESIPLSKDCLMSLGRSSDALRQLKSLSLNQLEEVDDEVLDTILQASSCKLEMLNLKDIIRLTDEALSSIRRCNTDGKLRALQISGCKALTSAGLETFFTGGIRNLCEPPILRMLDLSRCDKNVLNDEIIKLALSVSSNIFDPTDARSSSLTGLVYMNLSESCITDKTLEILSEMSASSLQELEVNFCPFLTNQGLGYVISKLNTQFRKLHIWGNAQITDEFLDGHDRIDSGGLEIIGAWMKKSGTKSV